MFNRNKTKSDARSHPDFLSKLGDGIACKNADDFNRQASAEKANKPQPKKKGK
jgi:hypothetical protein